MRSRKRLWLLCLLALFAGCGESPQPKPAEQPPNPAAPAVPEDVQQAAEAILGAGAEVLTFGDLAHTGHRQALIINRLPKTPAGVVPGILFTRAAILEEDGGKWKEIFRCDDYLKNAKGYLGGTPIRPVTTWRLQYEENAERGLQLYFTPLALTGATHIPTIGVRWNPKVNRYQSLDRNYEHFLSEVESLEPYRSTLR